MSTLSRYHKMSAQDWFASEVLARIIDSCSIPSFVIDRDHNVTHWNTAVEALTGIKRGDILGTDGQWRAFYREKRPVMADLIVDGASEDEIVGFYGRRCRKSSLIKGAYEAGDFFPDLGDKGKYLRITASPIKNDDGATIGGMETLEDVTRRMVAEENLHYYVRAITTAQEEERKRIARELHDDTVQVLTSLSRQIDNYMRGKKSLTPELSRFLSDLQEQLNAGAKSVHSFSQALRLSLLDDLGLIPALRSLVGRVSEGNQVRAVVEVAGEERRLGPEVETAVFRIVQEAVNNIRKHAQPCDASVRVEFAPDKVRVVISDNGKGFDLSEGIDALPRGGKLGLAGIRERVRLLAGTFHVWSSPGQGTRLTLEIPAR